MSKAKANELVAVLCRREVEDFDYPMRWNAEQRAEAVEAIGQAVRVQRPGLVAALLPTGSGRSTFARLPVLSAAALAKVEAAVKADDQAAMPDGFDGLVLPDDSLGRKLGQTLADGDQAVAKRQVESVRLWVKQQLGQDGQGVVHGEDQSWVIVPAAWA